MDVKTGNLKAKHNNDRNKVLQEPVRLSDSPDRDLPKRSSDVTYSSLHDSCTSQVLQAIVQPILYLWSLFLCLSKTF